MSWWHGSKAQCCQTHLLPVRHPAFQPISEANGKCKTGQSIYTTIHFTTNYSGRNWRLEVEEVLLLEYLRQTLAVGFYHFYLYNISNNIKWADITEVRRRRQWGRWTWVKVTSALGTAAEHRPPATCLQTHKAQHSTQKCQDRLGNFPGYCLLCFWAFFSTKVHRDQGVCCFLSRMQCSQWSFKGQSNIHYLCYCQ